ncbi:uncharacterized protein LOC141902652 [Tubulanus polymorphus]|uniref:uncharacterized protein LOC141902652 n=1 Tax=Tubulanus polymorphus TaxID=672921 RepID=UPI003DA66022
MPQQSSISRWASNELALQPIQCTDHWAKLRVKSGNVSARTPHELTIPHQSTNKESVQNKTDANEEGRHPVFQSVPVRTDLDGLMSSVRHLPGNSHLDRAKTSHGHLRTSYNERARQGFKYWPMERPKPTKFARYGIGSYKTVLGLGNAPRT